ncbi:MAG: flippase-like domain-containing protein [Chloroflexi bacterium]|nr:flippase-like domain-containing protein [Chloroflexota bacterium]
MKQHIQKWGRMLLSVGVGAVGVWLLARDVAVADVFTAAGQAHWGYVAGAVAVVFLTPLLKAWRWRWLFPAEAADLPLLHLIRIILVAMFFGQIVPIARLGEVSRVVLLGGRIPRAQILSTLVVEKVLEVVMVVLSLLLVLPLVAMPPNMGQPQTWALLGVGLLVGLAAVAYTAEPLTRLSERVTNWLPAAVGGRLHKLIATGLQGVMALRHGRALGRVLAASVGVVMLYWLAPYLLFQAFAIPLGPAEAVLLNGVLLLGLVPSSAPGNVGVFEFLCLAVLRPLDATDEATLLGFALLFHGIVLLPQLVGGVLAVGVWGEVGAGRQRSGGAEEQRGS